MIALNDYVLVQNVKTSSTFEMPESKEKSWKGEVLSVWPWKMDNWILIPIDNIKVWDVIYYTKYQWQDVEGKTFVRADFILWKEING